MNTDMLSTQKGFFLNGLALYLNTIKFETINQCLTIIISCLAVTYWILKLINERKAMKICQKDEKKPLK
jgi:hypothetical protein